ncbi:MAG: hypothetical protein ACLQBX_10520 [Candidatus Limnocylindrales bacterium]|jgi:hypothetical protein
MPDELETILRLVAEGHLSAEDAAPIVEALRDHARQSGAAGREGAPSAPAHEERVRPPGGRGAGADAARQLRVEVTEAGRQVVNVRVPLGLASLAVERVPGLPGQVRGPILEAIRAGLSGPIVDVGEGGDHVRVVLE